MNNNKSIKHTNKHKRTNAQSIEKVLEPEKVSKNFHNQKLSQKLSSEPEQEPTKAQKQPHGTHQQQKQEQEQGQYQERISRPLSETEAGKDHMDKDKKANDIEEAFSSENVTLKPIAISEETKQEFVVPIRATISNKDKHLDITKTSIWALMTLSNMTIAEVEEFEQTYGENLTYNELASIQLLKRTVKNDPNATKIFWDINGKVLNRPTVVNQMNISTGESGSIMSQMLDEIAKNITKDEAIEGDVVED